MIKNDILYFKKLDAGKVELELCECDISLLLGKLVHTYEHLALNKDLTITLGIDEAIHTSYQIDDKKLSQVIGNLINNAIKYTESGYINVEARYISGGGADKDVVRFVITDTGIGIPEDHFGKLFESFSEPKTITTGKQEGSGLGLAIVKKIVELHNSEIIFNSVVDKGSTFSFDLLLTRSKYTKTPVDDAKKVMVRNVLLAEDNMINAMVAQKLLAKWGIITDHAIDGLAAVAMANQKLYDIILMDIHMPEMNGFDAAKKIRSTDNLNCATPIYALTADITVKDQTDYVNYFTGFLSKPIEIEKLRKAMTVNLFQ